MDIVGSLVFKGTGTLKNAVAETFANTAARDTAYPSPRAGQLVYITALTGYQYYNGTSWQDFSIGNVDTLDELTDVTITSSAAGQVLYTTGANTWVNGNIGSASGVQAYDAGLTSIAGLTTAADTMIYTTALDVYTTTTLTSFGRSLIDDASASAARTTLGLVIGTDVQAFDAELAALAGLTSAADSLPYFTGSGTAALTTLTSFGRSLIDDASASAARTTLGLVIGTDVQAQDADLQAIASYDWTTNPGIVVMTTGGTVVNRSITAPAAGITITNPAGIAGNPTLVLANDLAALEGLSSTGFAVRSASDTWVQRSITSTGSTITVTNGDGVSGNANLDLPNVGTAVTAQFVKITTDNQGRVSATTPVVTGDITGLVDSTYVNVTGDTMSGTLTMTGASTHIVLPNSPTIATHATNKNYVDSLVTSGTKWKSPIIDSNLLNVVTAQPGSPVAQGTYIKFGGTQAETWTGTPSVVVSDNDIITRNADNNGWIIIDTLSADDRFILAGEVGSIPSTSNALYTAGFRDGDLIQYVSGNPNTGSNWTTPHEQNYQVIDFTVAKVGSDATGLANDATVYVVDVKVNSTTYNVMITGSTAQTISTLITQINADLTGATASLDSEGGHIHITGSVSTDRIEIIHTSTGGTNLLTTLTNFDRIRSSVEDGATVIVNDAESLHYGHTFHYDSGHNVWTEIAGPGSIGAGIGLAYSGNTLNVNLGAGIAQLPSDEVGVHIYNYTSNALGFATSGGSHVATEGAAVTGDLLHLFLDGSTLTNAFAGLKVSSGGITGTELNASVAGAGLSGGGGSALSVNVDNSSIEINVDTLQVKAAGITNAMLAGSITAGKLTVNDGQFIVGNASNVGALVTPTGDVTFNNTGVFAITAGAIVNADINSAAAIDFSKLATLTSANIILGNASNVATSTAVTGDVTISNTGVTAIGAAKVTNAMLVNSSITIAGDSGSDAVALGETFTFDGNATQGVSTSMATNTLSITVADATTSSKGVASFNSSHFSTSSGAVSLNATLSDLTDVSDTIVATDGHVLTANGTEWTNQKVYHLHSQTSASSSWTVAHNLGQQFCNVTIAESQPEISTVNFGSLTGASFDLGAVAGKYFTLSAPEGAHYVWFRVTDGGTPNSETDPAPGGTGIMVSILSADTASQIATKTATAIDALAAFGATASTNVVTITNATDGSVTDIAAATSGTTVSVTQQGISEVILADTIKFDGINQLTATFSVAIKGKAIVMGIA